MRCIENFNVISVQHFKKKVGIKYCIAVAVKICRLLIINIHDFSNLIMFKLFLRKFGFSEEKFFFFVILFFFLVYC